MAIALLFAFTCISQTQVEVFVNSRGTNAIKKYDENGKYMGHFIDPGAGGLIVPEDIVFHPDGTVLVTGAGNTAIKRYDGQTGQLPTGIYFLKTTETDSGKIRTGSVSILRYKKAALLDIQFPLRKNVIIGGGETGDLVNTI